ncbi:DUF2384 domain-containing protein [Alteromonas pelagimontana]|uniref:DUF2384 domain-containing protein n=1 Tax=Alteromonas pelagimontana TaxID=1858656 RepID=A0A6M4MCV4_9ALTE|nr:MbcA/ParS/Xre antitoxin family protein [Alteromonas pelagimontana]QJR80678.1 DUF2384 domain-containing protein [Alteromonas pelagimontana]
MTTTHNPPAVVMKAFTWAYQELGLTANEAAVMLGISEVAMHETALVGFEVETPESELQLAFIRLYHLLYALLDGDTDLMVDWFTRTNPHLNVIPKTVCHNLPGIEYVNDYLESIQGNKEITEVSYITAHPPEVETELVSR